MGKTVRKFVNFIYNDYISMEEKLNRFANRGLFLEKASGAFWKFRKGEPKDLKYAITYFSDSSFFDSENSESLKSYIEYGKEYGYEFVDNINQIQIFVTEAENNIPFETDEAEKFENIKKCMKKSFLPTILLMLACFALNLFFQISTMFTNPIRFFSSNTDITICTMMFVIVSYYLFIVISYFIWCKKSKKSLFEGGGLPKASSNITKFIDFFVSVSVFLLLLFMILDFAKKYKLLYVVLVFSQVPILILVLLTLVKILKRLKLSRGIIKFAYILGAIVFSILYAFIIGNVVFNYDEKIEEYRKVEVTYPGVETFTYEVYNDYLPLTSQDLYGDEYIGEISYEHNSYNTIFLTREEYIQNSVPNFEIDEEMPDISYDILRPKFDFVSNMILKELTNEDYFMNYEKIDNDLFGTTIAYQDVYEGIGTGRYTLFYEDKGIIIDLNLDGEVTETQRDIILEKLISTLE